MRDKKQRQDGELVEVDGDSDSDSEEMRKPGEEVVENKQPAAHRRIETTSKPQAARDKTMTMGD